MPSAEHEPPQGVSCPGQRGLSAADALQIAFLSGRHPKVRLMDLSEFNPDVADPYMTARLVASIFYYFCLGRAAARGLTC